MSEGTRVSDEELAAWEEVAKACPGHLVFGRAAEEPDTVLLGDNFRLWCRVVGDIPGGIGESAEARARKLVAGWNILPILIAEVRRLRAELDDAQGDSEVLSMVREALIAIGCRHGPDTHKNTPPMMYPEWVGCAVHSAVMKERERCAGIADKCSQERGAAITRQPAISTPAQSQVIQWLRCKQSEADRIAEAIRREPSP